MESAGVDLDMMVLKLYEAVVKNPVYAHVTREEVRRLYEK